MSVWKKIGLFKKKPQDNLFGDGDAANKILQIMIKSVQLIDK